jgi:conjugal transfer pilus assembly protein TraK
MIGVALVAVSFFLITSPAWADQTVMAADGSQVDCAASAKDLTRISLVEDEFASVSKISTGNPQDDFSVVNEPVRETSTSRCRRASRARRFFLRRQARYVYKIVPDRRRAGRAALHLQSGDREGQRGGEWGAPGGVATSPQEAAVVLIQAMYSNSVADGYEMRQRTLRRSVGNLKVQMIAEYRGRN